MAGSSTDTYDLTIDLQGSAATDPSQVVAGRYVVKESIGAGRFGSVWRALDRVREVDVALKIVPAHAPSDLDHVRRELTALRWLRLPGVARMRDEGIDGNRWFIVMDLVDGENFPGLTHAADWDLLWPRAEALLEVLVRLHAARIVHRDLKPANVMADAAGRVTIVDFGIASGRAGIAAPVERFVGTPRYASPEQCAGKATGPRSDLYSVGVMLYEALAGDVPHRAANYAQLIQRRREEPAPSLCVARPDLPVEVVRVIDAMLKRSPRERPSTAQVVLDRLRGPGWRTSVVGRPFDKGRQHPWSSLKKRFHGPNRFSHLQTDAARELWRRTAGQPARLHQELEAWVRAGLVHLDGDRMRISRRALDQLADGLRVDPTRIPPADDSAEQCIADRVRIAFPYACKEWVRTRSGLTVERFDATVRRMRRAGRLWSVGGRWFCGAELNPVPHWKTLDQQHMLTDLTTWAADQGIGGSIPQLMLARIPAPIVARAAEAAADLIQGGDHRRASALIRLALARSTPHDTHSVERMLVLRACIAQAEGTATSCNEALYLVDRHGSSTDSSSDAHRLIRATRARLSGEVHRAERWMGDEPTTTDEYFNLAWNRLKTQVARLHDLDAVEESLARMKPWAQHNTRRHAHWMGWLGVLRYQQGRFEEAASLCMQAAERRQNVAEGLGNQIDAAGALLECRRYQEAATLAESARVLARRIRRARPEAVATFINRSARYRIGTLKRTNPSLAWAALDIAPYTGALLCMVEAAIAYRARRFTLCAKLAEQASRSYAQIGNYQAADLMTALAAAAGADLDVGLTAARARDGQSPEMSVQILFLLRVSGRPISQDEVRRAAERVPRARWSNRLDVLSVQECVGDELVTLL